ncbi:hypothetical protein HDU97_002237 [Phlyctochytrium planicorne]|nr:hypothetical protein HDU97_002237 [Phlyctochytrium planicorne]
MLPRIQPGDTLLSRLEPKDWVTVFKTLVTFSKRSRKNSDQTYGNVTDVAEHALKLMLSVKPEVTIERSTALHYCKLLAESRLITSLEDAKNILESWKDMAMDASTFKLFLSALVLEMISVEKQLLSWDVAKEGLRMYQGMATDSNGRQFLFSLVRDYDSYLSKFAHALPSLRALEGAREIIADKKIAGFDVDANDIWVLARLTTTPHGIRNFLETVKEEYNILPGNRAFLSLLRNCADLKDRDLMAEILTQALQTLESSKEALVKEAFAHVQYRDFKGPVAIYKAAVAVDPSFASNLDVRAKLLAITAWQGIVAGTRDVFDRYKQVCFALDDLPEGLLDKLPIKDLSTLMQAHINASQPYEALKLYETFKPALIGELKAAANDEDNRDLNPGSLHAPLAGTIDRLIANLVGIRGDITKGEALYRDVIQAGCVPSDLVYGAFLFSLAGTNPRLVQSLLDDMKRMNVRKSAKFYRQYTTVLAKSGHLSMAILDEMKQDDIEPDIYVFNNMISSYAKKGDLDRAREVRSLMEQYGFKPDATTYNIFLETSLTRGRWDEAQIILDEMKRIGVPHDDVTYNILIAAHGNREGGNPEEGKRLYQVMKQKGLRITIHTNNAMIRCHCALREWDEVEAIIDRERQSREKLQRPSQRTFDIYLRELAYAAGASPSPVPLLQRISKVLDRMHSQSFIPQPTSIGALIRAASKLKNVELAKRYHDLLGSSPLAHMDTINSAMISAFDAAGDYHGAVAWANREWPGSGIGQADIESLKNAAIQLNGEPGVRIGRASTYALMIAHAKAGNKEAFDAVRAQLTKIEATGLTLFKEEKTASGVGINETNVLLQCYNYFGDIESTVKLWDSLFQSRKTDTVDVEAIARSERGSDDLVSQGSRIVKSSLYSKGLVEKFGFDRITVSQIIDGVGVHGTMPQLKTLWEKLIASNFPMDLNNWISYLEALARLGNYKNSVDLVVGPDSPVRAKFDLTEKVFYALIPLLKDVNEARRLWEFMRQNYPHMESRARSMISEEYWASSGMWVDE